MPQALQQDLQRLSFFLQLDGLLTLRLDREEKKGELAGRKEVSFCLPGDCLLA